MSAFAGQTVTLSFTGAEDYSLQTSFVLDDIALNTSGDTAPPADSTRTPAAPAYTVSLTSNTARHRLDRPRERDLHQRLRHPAQRGVPAAVGQLPRHAARRTPITVTNVTGGTAGALSVACTALKITLPAPLAQGQSATIGFDLGITVPSGADRFGHDGAFNFIGNALPVLAVKDAAGWHLDPYTNNGESFYSLAADFKVTLDHPTRPARSRPPAPPSTPPAPAAARSPPPRPPRCATSPGRPGPFSKISGTSPAGAAVNVYSVIGHQLVAAPSRC